MNGSITKRHFLRTLSAGTLLATLWNGWRNLAKGAFSDYGRLLAEGKFEDIVALTKQL
jgi:hypothetical protein